MNKTLSRRQTLTGMMAVSLLSAAPSVLASTHAKVVIVGGGFGGASAAMALKEIAPNLDVTLIEAQPTYTACPFSNLVLAGERNIESQKFSYSGLVKAGVNVVHGYADNIDPEKKKVRLKDEALFDYDRLILSPGIDFLWNAIEGYDEQATASMPHAWKAGPQTLLLTAQLEAMNDGGLVLVSVPPAPFRCPPGPYERVSLIAHYLKTNKPRSKILLLDAQDRFSKQPLFEEAWDQFYPGLIERIPGAESGRVISVNPSSNILNTDFDSIQADVANVIPPQKAGRIADVPDVTNASGWCSIDASTF